MYYLLPDGKSRPADKTNPLPKITAPTTRLIVKYIFLYFLVSRIPVVKV